MVVSELIQLVRDGVRAVSSTAQIIVWNWSWHLYEANPNPTIVAALPDDVILMAGFERGEWVESNWLDGFKWPEIHRAVGILHREWKKGVALLERGLAAVAGSAAKAELDNAYIIYHCLRSTWNAYRCFRLRKNWSDSKLPQYLRIATNELANLQAVLPILERNPMHGWHGEPHIHMFDADGVRKKIHALEQQTE